MLIYANNFETDCVYEYDTNTIGQSMQIGKLLAAQSCSNVDVDNYLLEW